MTKRLIVWLTWLAWSPLIVVVVWHLSMAAICGDGACIGKAGLLIINELVGYSKMLVLGLLGATTLSTLLRKLTKLGWTGFAVSLAAAMYHILIIKD